MGTRLPDWLKQHADGSGETEDDDRAARGQDGVSGCEGGGQRSSTESADTPSRDHGRHQAEQHGDACQGQLDRAGMSAANDQQGAIDEKP